MFVQTHPPDLDSPQSSAADGKKARAEEEDDFFFFSIMLQENRKVEEDHSDLVQQLQSLTQNLVPKCFQQSVQLPSIAYLLHHLEQLGNVLSGTLHSHFYFVFPRVTCKAICCNQGRTVAR